MGKLSTKSTGKISADALRRFADNRRIFNRAVQKAVEENRRLGIPDEEVFARPRGASRGRRRRSS